MNFEVPNFYPALAEIFVAVMALVLMLAGTFFRRIRGLGFVLAEITLIGAAFITLATLPDMLGDAAQVPAGRSLFAIYTFNEMYISDLFGGVLKLMIYCAMAVALLYGRGYLADRNIDRHEYYLLALLMTLGMMVMVSANHMLTMYIGLEMMSLALYGMVAFDRDNSRSAEAAMKYFVLGALASGLLLYGMSMVYGATGMLSFDGIAQNIALNGGNMVLLLGLVFIVAGICFKLGVVPFHMWIPDVYQGAPSAVTLVIASAPKLAAFAMAMRLLAWGMPGLDIQWHNMLLLVALASIILGNLAAIVQHNIKRMLAYSGISHMGFVLLGLFAGVHAAPESTDMALRVTAYSAAMFYAIAYVLMSLASFGIILLFSRAGFEAERLEDFKGLNKRNAWFAAVMMFVMFSMAGIPFFVGFFAKFSILAAVVQAGYVWVAVVAIIMSVIGAFYYLRVVKVMYADEPEETSPIAAPAEFRVLLSANGFAIALFGLMPAEIMFMCLTAIQQSLPSIIASTAPL